MLSTEFIFKNNKTLGLICLTVHREMEKGKKMDWEKKERGKTWKDERQKNPHCFHSFYNLITKYQESYLERKITKIQEKQQKNTFLISSVNFKHL